MSNCFIDKLSGFASLSAREVAVLEAATAAHVFYQDRRIATLTANDAAA